MTGRSFFFVAGMLIGAAAMLACVRVGLVPPTWNPLPFALFGLLLLGSWLLGRLTRPRRSRATTDEPAEAETGRSSTAIQPQRPRRWSD